VDKNILLKKKETKDFRNDVVQIYLQEVNIFLWFYAILPLGI